MSWDEFLTLAVEYLTAQQERLSSELGLGHWPRYDFDQETGTLTFSAKGRPGWLRTSWWWVRPARAAALGFGLGATIRYWHR
jgi:hypothetical protein